MYVHLRPIRTFEADRTLPGEAVRAAVKSARLARGSDMPSPGRVQSASNVRNRPQMYRESASNVQRISLKCTAQNRPQMYRESASNVCTFEANRTLLHLSWARASDPQATVAPLGREISETGPRIGRPCPGEVR